MGPVGDADAEVDVEVLDVVPEVVPEVVDVLWEVELDDVVLRVVSLEDDVPAETL